ncbi:MAG: helix-turn-helix domain-containing protein [Myxococcota bacterium]
MKPPTETFGLGLRARKRRETRRQILATAVEVFRRRGIRAAHLGEIARASEISPATLFNYFPNKGALAEAWVRGEIEQIFREAEPDLRQRGLRSAIGLCCRRLAALVSGGADQTIRLEAWSEAGRAPKRFVEASHPLVEALRHWQVSERVRGDIKALTMAEMLIEAVEGGLIDGLRRDLNHADLEKGLRMRVDLLLDGVRKRNERVAAPTPHRGR